MLKVVVFDGGYGGEFFADRLQDELPVIEIIRVIDWRNADKILKKPKAARKIAKNALRPYIGKVDLIIFAKHLLTITSLKYFERKYRSQRFIGLNLKEPDTFAKRDILIMTTKAVTKTINYYNYLLRLKRKSKTLVLDAWPLKIDDGELTIYEIKETVKLFLLKNNFNPREIVLACSQFEDIKKELREIFGKNIKIHDSFNDTLYKACKILKIRGRLGKRKK